MRRFDEMINEREGLISNQMFSAEIHEQELERIFGHTWLFVAHDTMIPNPHDYITNFMGADPVVIQRDAKGKVRVYLNKCRHRGAEVCLYESGNAPAFTCSYHGWTYRDGALMGMPFAKEAYREELDRSKFGLIEAPRVAQLGGLIFASWDADIMPLDDYLGDAKWYLENFLLHEEMGGLEVVPGAHRYMMPINWKLLAENFAGDDYHFVNTHASVIKIMQQAQDQRIAHAPNPGEKMKKGYDFSIAANYKKGPPHGFLEVKVGPESFSHDMTQAKGLGPDAVEWLEERQRRIEARIARYTAKPYSFHAGNIFPNLALIGCGTAMYGKGLILHHPHGPDSTEVWMYCMVEKSAPQSVKERQKFVLMQRQAAAGMVAPDDHENFARIRKNLHTPMARDVKFHYAMQIGHDLDEHRPEDIRDSEKWPGLAVPQFSEVMQRDFYRYWAELMDKAA